MKRIKLFSLAAIFCAAAAVGYNTYQQSTMTEQERLLQANLEALSEIEPSPYTNWISYQLDCSCGGTVPSCLWSCDGSGSECLPDLCPTCGNEGVYFY